MRRAFVMVGALVLLLTACIEDKFELDHISDEVHFTSGLNLPLAYADVSLKDILSEKTDKVKYYRDQDGNERVLLQQSNDSVEYVGLNDFISLSVDPVALPVPFSVFNTVSTITEEVHVPFQVPNSSLSEIHLNYRTTIEAIDMAYPVQLELHFPGINATEGGRTIRVQLSGNQTESFLSEEDVVQLNNNQLKATVSLTPLQPNQVFENLEGNISISFTEMDLSYVKGIMAENAVSVEEGEVSLELDVFEHFNQGITFDDPKLQITITNTTPFRGSLSPQLTAVGSDDVRVNLQAPPLLFYACPVSQPLVLDTLSYDKTNSNVKDIFHLPPKLLEYSGGFVLNPGAELQQEVELDGTDRIYVGYAIEVPVEFTLDSRVEVDSIDIDLAGLTENMSKARLSVLSINEFPVQAIATIEFWDEETRSVVESIDTKMMEAAPVNSDGISTGARESQEEIELSENQLEALKESEKLILNVHLISTNFESGQSVVLLADNDLSIKIGLKTQIDVNH
jgi:hypothetical protein